MFVKAIELVKGFTRPIHTITRTYGSTVVVPGAATLFFVNENGWAVTCKHVAQLLIAADQMNVEYGKFKAEKDALAQNNKYKRNLRDLEAKYNLNDKITVQIKNNFVGCVDKMSKWSLKLHPTEDLAIVQLEGYSALSYHGYATFLADTSKIKQGKSLCRLGYPFPEFSNYKYNDVADDIEWTGTGQLGTPQFPIDGILTRLVHNNNKITGIEMSTPGLKGQSGGPLFDQDGIVYGMQSKTLHLHLGFDLKDHEIQENGKTKKVSNSPFLHVGRCVHADVIKEFLKQEGVKFYEA